MALTNRKFIFEVVEAASKAKTRQEKINILRENETWALKDVLRVTFDDVIQLNLPAGAPPYEAAEEESVPTNLLKQNKQFKYFVKGGPGDSMPAFKREALFIRLIESIHPKDAEILLTMKDKKQPAKGITKKLVEEAFPGLIVK